MPKRILCFGDSLTWGWTPVAVDGEPTVRYPFEQRWTGKMLASLGGGYEVIEEALSGRTTNIDDPLDPRLNGAAYLPAALASHLPLDLVIVLLGSNDTKTYFDRSPFDIATGAALLLKQIGKSAGGVGTAYPAPKALLIAPPIMGRCPEPWSAAQYADGPEKTAAIAPLFRAAAAHNRAGFLNAGDVISTGGVDGLHLTAENNAALGLAIAAKVKEILG